MSANDRIFSRPAHILHSRLSQEELVDLAKTNQAFDASVFDEHDIFIIPTEMSSTRLDFYGTWMMPSTLSNFARAARNGVAFLDSHNSRRLPFGRSVYGDVMDLSDDVVAAHIAEIEDTSYPGDEINHQRVLIDWYTIRGKTTSSGMTTDDYIAGVRAGIYRDTSVGFYGGTWICDICGIDLWKNWRDCPHIPGFMTVVEGDDGEERQIMATAGIDGADLSEGSLVYDGATPGAMVIDKAERMAGAGLMLPEQARLIEARFALPRHLSGAYHTWPGYSVDAGVSAGYIGPSETNAASQYMKGGLPAAKLTEHSIEEAVETPRKERSMTDERIEGVYRFVHRYLHDRGIIDDDSPEAIKDGVRQLVNERNEVRATLRRVAVVGEDTDLTQMGIREGVEELAGEIERLKPLADDGETYRSDLVDEAIAAGVRANGDGFDEATYRATLERASIEFVKRMRDDWLASGDKRFSGGRKTVEGDTDEAPETPDEAPETTDDRGTPAIAFMG